MLWVGHVIAKWAQASESHSNEGTPDLQDPKAEAHPLTTTFLLNNVRYHGLSQRHDGYDPS